MNSRIKWLSVVTALVMLITSALPFAALASGDADGDLIDLSSSNPAQESNMQAEPGDASPDTGTAIEFIEDAGAAEENAGDETTQRSEDVNNAAAPADNTQQTASDTDANTVDNNDSPGEEGAPAVDSSAAVQQDTPAEDTVIDAEPVVDPVPEQDIAPVIDLSNALSDRTFGRDPYDGKVDNGDNVSGKASFKATMALDKIRLTVSSSNINYKSLSMPGFANAGNATISVYKWFEIEYENENGKTQKKKVTAPFIENVSASAAMSLTNLDKGYGEFEGAIPGAQATFLNCYFIDIVNVPSGLSGEFVVKGKTTGLSEENNKAGASVSAYVKCGDSDNTLGFESVRFTYTAPETEPEPEPVPEEQNGDVQDDNAGEETVTPDESDVPEVANDSGDQAGEDTQPVVEEDKSSADNTPAEPTVQEPVSEDKIDGTTPVDGTPSADDNTDTSENNENKEEEIAPVVDEPAPARGLSSKKGGALLGSPDRSASAYTIKIGAAYTYSSAYGLMNDYPLSGVSIKVTDENGYENSITTGEDGIASIADLPEGEYTLTVTGYNDTDYVANKTSESITWNSDASNTMARLQQDGNGDLVHVVFGFRMKAKERTLKITLKDKTSGDPISGMTVRVGDVSDVTNDNGYVELTATTSGPFQVALGLDGTDYNNQENAQVIPGRAYDDMSPTTIEATYELVKTEPEETDPAEAETVDATIKVVLLDKNTNDPVEGITVTATADEDTASGITGEDGSVTLDVFTNLDDPWTYAITLSGLESTAYDNDANKNIEDNTIEMTATTVAAFTIYLTPTNNDPGSIKVTVTDKEGGFVAGAVAKIVGPDEDTTEKTAETNENGVALFENLVPGTYTLSLTVPEGYSGQFDPKEVPVTAGAESGVVYTVAEVSSTGSLNVFVMVTEDEADEPVQGASIGVAASEAEKDTKTTGEDGKAAYTDLEPGTYTVTLEGLPEGYTGSVDPMDVNVLGSNNPTEYTIHVLKASSAVTTGTVTFTAVYKDEEGVPTPVAGVKISVGKEDSETAIDKTTGEDGTVVFDNLEPGRYIATVDEVPAEYENNFEPMAFEVVAGAQGGTTLELDKKSEEPATTGTIKVTFVYVDGDVVTPVAGAVAKVGETEKTSDENGQAVFDELEPGSYTVVMVSAPSPYVIEEGQSIDARVVAGAESPVNVKLAKNVETTEPGSIKVTFTYVDGNTETPVAGAVAKVGEVEKTSDENGQAVFDELEPGSYTVTIVSVPEPYTMGEDGRTAEVSVVAGSETPLAVHPAKKSETTETGKIVVTVVNSETNDPVEGVTIIIKTSDPDDEGTEYVTLEDGKATAIKDPGSYTIVVNSVPAGYNEIEYSKDVAIESGVQLHETIKLDPAEVEPEDLVIVEFTGLSFDPEEQTVVPTTEYNVVLNGYALKLNQENASADEIKFSLIPVSSDMRLKAVFSGHASSIAVKAISGSEVLTPGLTVEKDAESGLFVFDSAVMPAYDPETHKPIVDEDGGFFPEGTEFVWIMISNPSPDFDVNEFTLTGTTSADFEQVEFSMTTEAVFTAIEKVTDTNVGVVKKGDPQATLTIQGSAAKLNTGDSINYTVNFENTSKVKYQNATLEVVVDSKFIPSRLNPGMWTGYNGEIEIISVGTDGSTKSLMTINPNECGAIMLTETSVKSFRFVTKAAVAGDVSIENIVLDGEFVDAGTAKTSAKFNGTIAEGVHCTADSGEITTEIVKPEEPVTTGTISVTVKDAAGNPVKDVVFTVAPVTGSDGVPVTMKTDGNGVAQIECNIGKYKVTLSGGIPDKYKDPAFSKEIDVSGGAVMTETVTLEEKPITTGTIEITALLDGAEEETPVQGVKFTLYRKTEGAESIKIGTGVTQENGVLTDTLEAGEYLLKSAGVPDGYEDLAYEKEITITAGETTKEKVFVKKSSQPTPTPTPDPGSDPVPPGPSGGGSGTDPTPTPEPVMLFVDSPKITSNSSSVAYGEDALFYIRGLNARGMELTDYYVLHLMIPTGIQVKTLTFPGFGTDTRVTLTYESGTTELGVYNGGETVNLTERQGMNLRYIAFQIHGVDSVSATGDIQLLVKNISARDRIVTLQAILSLRDNRTKVISDNLNKRGEITPSRTNIPSGMTAQNSDRYNISVAGPKSSNSGSSGTTGTTGTTSESGSPVTEMAASVRVRKCYPQMCFSSSKVEPKVIVIDKKNSTKPLLANSVNVMPGVRSVTDAQIVDQPVTNELIAAKVKQKTAALKRIVLALNKVNPKSMNK